MKVIFKRFDTSLPIPAYQSSKAAAFDLYARETVSIKPHQVGRVPLNIAVQVPPGCWALVAARSSLHKKGVMLANGIGIGDEDFAGDSDEYQAVLLNFTDQEVTITKGDRICQMMIMSVERAELVEVEYLVAPNRGGIGSTG